MHKILIWDLNINLLNTGGPAGYLYNIHEFLKNREELGKAIFFLKDILEIKNVDSRFKSQHSKINRILGMLDCLSIIGFWRFFRAYKKWFVIDTNEQIANLDLSQYDAIHFHRSTDLCAAIDLLKDYKGKVLLTSHSPQPLSYEMLDNIPFGKRILCYLFLDKMLLSELKAWNRADYLVFPVEGAIEPYFVEPKMKAYLESHYDKIKYCPSAILDEKECARYGLREKLNVPENVFLVSYIGRHTAVKGYDQLKRIAKAVLSERSDVYFVIAGNQSPMKGLQNPRWIELGWINYGNEVIANSDVFVLPNKETYFDLVALEVMRQGTPILMTKTGGNKYFLKYGEENGFFFYSYGDINEAKEKLYHIIDLKRTGDLKTKACNIRKTFEKNFTIANFVERYYELMETLLK